MKSFRLFAVRLALDMVQLDVPLAVPGDPPPPRLLVHVTFVIEVGQLAVPLIVTVLAARKKKTHKRQRRKFHFGVA